MGVTGLWKLIEQSGKPVPLETLEGKILAIDISIWLHQVVKGYQDGRGGAVQNAHLIGLFNRLCKLLFFRIKPVFVFDGGIPQLKRMTIEKRSMQRNKTQNEANRVEQILLETLAKEKIVQQALGKSVKDIVSPRKAQQLREARKKDDDLFVLPPLEESLGVSRLEESDEEPGDGDEEKLIGDLGASEIAKIDVTHPLFKSLPADKRHAILYELKETRKQSSWGRLHEMPPDGGNFSEFQMKRLLKRRNVQVSLEEAELEMGGKSLSLMELDELLREDGIVEGDNKGQRIASNENARFVYIKDTLKAIEESKKAIPKPEMIPELEDDVDLQMAIAMSLQDDNDPANLTQLDVAKASDIKLSTPQRQYLKNINKAPAREYMLEYGILNDDTIQDMFKGKQDEKPQTTAQIDTVSISSSTDSDFIDVPEDDFSSEVVAPPTEPFPLPNETPSKEFRLEDLNVVQVQIDPNKAKCDDLFADVFLETPVNVSKSPEYPENESKGENKRPLEDSEDLNKTQPLDLTEYQDIFNVSREPTLDLSPHKKIKLDNSQDEPIQQLINTVCEYESLLKEVDILPPPKQKRDSIDTVELKSPPKETLVDPPAAKMQKQDSIDTVELEKHPLKKTGVEPLLEKMIELSDSDGDFEPIVNTKNETSPKKSVVAKQLPTRPPQIQEPQPSSSKYVPPKISLPTPVMDLPKDEEVLREMEKELQEKHRNLEKEMNKMDRHAVSVTERMSVDCQELLKLFGVPYIVAPMEAEAQCAFLNKYGLVDGIISDDSDVWLFGGSVVYKNFFDNKKIVLEYRSENIKNLFQMDQKSLIQLGMLVGSDYTSGIQGIGPVTALEIIAAFTSNDDCTDEAVGVISCLRKFRDWWINGKNIHNSQLNELKNKLKKVELIEGFPNLEVVKAYLYPEVDLNDEPFSWGFPNVDAIYEMTRRSLGWTQSKTDDILGPVLKKLNDKQKQKNIKNYFKVKEITHHKELVVSKRTEKSIRRLAGDVSVEEEKKQKKTRPKNAKKVKKASNSDVVEVESSQALPESQGEHKSPQKSSQTVKFVRPSPKKTPDKKKGNENPSNSKKESTKTRVPRIPNPQPPIPQRLKDEKEMEDKKKRAIELFNKKKNSK